MKENKVYHKVFGTITFDVAYIQLETDTEEGHKKAKEKAKEEINNLVLFNENPQIVDLRIKKIFIEI